ncbi:MAG: tyrosine-type recombinase/integrase [Candidatus Acidiferrales bacterium]
MNLLQPRLQAVLTLEDFVTNEWMPVVLPTLKHSTAMQYGFICKSHVLRELGQLRICDLSRECLQAFLSAKVRAGLSWETIAHIRNVANKILDSAVEWGYASTNVARLTKLPRRPPRKPRPFLTRDQINKLLCELREPVRTIALLLVVTGVRIGEILALRWGRVDLENGILQVREAVYDGHFGTPKTSSSVADLPLGPEMLAALKRHRQRIESWPHPEELVFSNRSGGSLNPKNLLRRVLYPACEKAGVPRISWHALRHSHATLLAAQGESPKLIQAQLRHSSVQLALQLYTHPMPGFQREAVERLERNLLAEK